MLVRGAVAIAGTQLRTEDLAGDPPPVVVLLDPHDDRAIMDAALAAHAPERGWITVHPTAGGHTDLILAHDLLLSLGKGTVGLNVQQLPDAAGAWAAAATWTLLENIATVIVVRTHLLSAHQWQRFLQLRTTTGVQLIMVHHQVGLAPPLRRCLELVEHHVSSDPALLAASPPAQPLADGTIHDTEESADGGLAPLPHVSAAALPWYRADAYRLLSAAEFSRLDAEYRQGLRAACRWLTHRGYDAARLTGPFPHVMDTAFPTGAVLTGVDHFLGRGTAPGAQPGAEQRRIPTPWRDHRGLQVFLSALIVDAPTSGHSVARIRGAQAAFLLHGLLLQPPQDLSTACGPGFGPQPFTRSAVHRICRQIAHPAVATALAIVLLTGEIPEVVARWDVPVVQDTGCLVLSGYHYAIPDHGRDLLLAASVFRRLHPGRTGRRLSTLIGADDGPLLSAARVCGLSLHADRPRHLPGRPWHYLTGCWAVGPALHELPSVSGHRPVPDPPRAP